MRPLMILVGLLCGGLFAPLAAARAEPPYDRFQAVLPEFMAAWDQRDQEAIARFIDPSLGVWVIYSIGVSRVPYHFQSLEEPLGQAEHGFGYLGGAGFGECRPEPGSPPVCGDGGVRVGGCRFGVTEPVFLQGVEDYLRSGAGKPAERARFRREGEELQRAAGDRVYFLSDEWWGAVFYFADRVDGWVLLAIEMEDCSA